MSIGAQPARPIVPPMSEDVQPSGGHDLDTLYRHHVDAVSRWAARLGGPTAEVEDIVHEVFLVAHRRLLEFRGDAKITTWLYRITVRVVHQQRRRQRWKRWLGLTDPGDTLAIDAPSPLQAIETRQAIEAAYRVLDGMGEKYRTVLILFELEGLSGEEIATIMGAKVGTVWVWLHRAREQFATRLELLELNGGTE